MTARENISEDNIYNLLMFLKAHHPFTSQNMDYAGSSPVGISQQKIDTTKIYSKKLTITTRNRVVAKESRCEENTIVGNYFFIFYDMPHFVRRDIFAFAKVIL